MVFFPFLIFLLFFVFFGLLHFSLFCIFVLMDGIQFYFLFCTFVCIFCIFGILAFLRFCIFVLFCFVLLYFCTFCTFLHCHLVGQTKYKCNFPYNIKAFRILLLQWHYKEKVPKTCVPPHFLDRGTTPPKFGCDSIHPPPRFSGMDYTSHIKECVCDCYW